MTQFFQKTSSVDSKQDGTTSATAPTTSTPSNSNMTFDETSKRWIYTDTTSSARFVWSDEAKMWESVANGDSTTNNSKVEVNSKLVLKIQSLDGIPLPSRIFVFICVTSLLGARTSGLKFF